jgi:hypothetical protein
MTLKDNMFPGSAVESEVHQRGIQAIGRHDLFTRVWSAPLTKIATCLGVKASFLKALAERLSLPMPKAGHWMKKEVGKEPPTPQYPADPTLDAELYPLFRPPVGRELTSRSTRREKMTPQVGGDDSFVEANEPSFTQPVVALPMVGEHRKVVGTRAALSKKKGFSERIAINGPGLFRLLIAPASGTRACLLLDSLVMGVEAKGWAFDDSTQGFMIRADGEAVGFMIEEKLDRIPHVITATEIREKAAYDRKSALAERGVGYRPWGPPAVPEYDYVPNGDLVLKFDHDYDAGGTRRIFSDGKRQRLEGLIASVIASLEKWGVAVKARREERAQWKRDWEEQERRRKDVERQARVEGYRIAFLRRQVDRRQEIEGLAGLIASWEEGECEDADFAELLEFARLYRQWLENKISPSAVSKRIVALKLMNDDVYIYDAKQID